MISKIKDKDSTQTVDQYLEDISAALVLNPVVPGSEKRSKLSGAEALTTVTKSSTGETKNIFLVDGNRGFQISFSGITSSIHEKFLLKDSKNLNIFETMLSTLKFLN